jgi:Prokaryotic E2 family E
MLRRQFELLLEDEQLLNDYGLPWETVVDGSHWVLIHDFPTHEGYNHKTVTAAIRLETGYPNTALDMVYFHPPLARLDGRIIRATEAVQQIAGVTYQRWSRHRTDRNPWRPSFDSLGTHIVLIEDWLEREFGK